MKTDLSNFIIRDFEAQDMLFMEQMLIIIAYWTSDDPNSVIAWLLRNRPTRFFQFVSIGTPFHITCLQYCYFILLKKQAKTDFVFGNLKMTNCITLRDMAYDVKYFAQIAWNIIHEKAQKY